MWVTVDLSLNHTTQDNIIEDNYTENFKCVAGKVLAFVCVCEREILSFNFSGLITAFTLSLLQTPQRQHKSQQLPDNSTYWERERECAHFASFCVQRRCHRICSHIFLELLLKELICAVIMCDLRMRQSWREKTETKGNVIYWVLSTTFIGMVLQCFKNIYILYVILLETIKVTFVFMKPYIHKYKLFLWDSNEMDTKWGLLKSLWKSSI